MADGPSELDKGEQTDDGLSTPPRSRDSIEAILAKAVAAPSEYPELVMGATVAERYTIQRVLGAGGMGTVYLAHDRTLDREVALKLHTTASARDRLHREALAMAKLAHPNVVAVFEVDELGGRAFVVMEYIAGSTLRAWLAARPRTRREILAALCAAGEGLAAAHDAGLVHRDVKPDNIFVGNDGRVRIGDFGLAQMPVDPTGAINAEIGRGTETGTVMGTPAYMAPEQIAAGELDARTDQFSFCVSGWEALCGDRPYHGATTEELRRAIVEHQLTAPKRHVPARLRRVLLRGMARDPSARWPSLHALIAALRSAERRPRVIAAVTAVALVAGAAIAWFAWPERDLLAECTEAGAEIDKIVPQSTTDAAAAAVHRNGRSPLTDGEERLVIQAATEFRAEYRKFARKACEAKVTHQWSPELAEASRQCIDYEAHVARELFAAGPATASQPSDVLQIVLRTRALGPCANANVLAGWQHLAVAPAELDAIVAARARLDAAGILVDVGQLVAARAVRDEIAKAAVHTSPVVARRLELLRGQIALAENDVKPAEKILADVYYDARAHDEGALTLEAVRDLIDLSARIRRDPVATERWVRDGLAEADRLRKLSPHAAFEVYISAASAANNGDQPERALELATRAAELASPTDEGDQLALLDVRSNALSAMGKLDEALEVDAKILAALRREFGSNHPRVADALAQSAALLLEAGRGDEAAARAREALAILDASGDDQSNSVATAETNVGATLLQLQDPSAEKHLARARAILVSKLGEDHPDVALIDTNLAIVHLDRDDIVGGLAMLQHATAVEERTLGPDHEELANGLYNLAVAERRAGKLDDAVASTKRAVEIYARHQAGSMRHARSLAQLASFENLRARPEDALRVAVAALELPGSVEDVASGAWARLEAGRALLALHRDLPRARRLLEEARTGFASLKLADRLTEIDGLLARAR